MGQWNKKFNITKYIVKCVLRKWVILWKLRERDKQRVCQVWRRVKDQPGKGLFGLRETTQKTLRTAVKPLWIINYSIKNWIKVVMHFFIHNQNFSGFPCRDVDGSGTEEYSCTSGWAWQRRWLWWWQVDDRKSRVLRSNRKISSTKTSSFAYTADIQGHWFELLLLWHLRDRIIIIWSRAESIWLSRNLYDIVIWRLFKK